MVSRAIRRNRAGFDDGNRPIGSFLFVGPTGVGKTELAKQLAIDLFGNKDALIRLDMSEYSDTTAVSKMIGTTAGYVGYDDNSNTLTEKYAVIHIQSFYLMKSKSKSTNFNIVITSNG